MTTLPQKRAKLYWLMELLTADHHDVGTFCKEFEQTYNFEVDKRNLSDTEQKVFKNLFDKVAWYSPYPKEREIVRQYQSGAQIREAVSEARKILGVS